MKELFLGFKHKNKQICITSVFVDLRYGYFEYISRKKCLETRFERVLIVQKHLLYKKASIFHEEYDAIKIK